MKTSKPKSSAKSETTKSDKNKLETNKSDKDKSKTYKNDLKFLSQLKDFEFIREYYDLSEDELKLHIVAGKLLEVLESYLKLIQQIVQPEEFYSLYESSAFDDTYKAKVMDLYKRIIVMHRELLKSELLHDKSFYLKTIESTHKLIIEIRPQILEIIDKMQKSWNNDSAKDINKGQTQYFG